MSEGRKNDYGKPHLCLIPPKALSEIGKVLSFGAEKYDPDNWRKVRPISRYLSAIMRHLLSVMEGEDLDEETGLPHLAHIGCCTLFALEMYLNGHPVRDWTFPENQHFYKDKPAKKVVGIIQETGELVCEGDPTPEGTLIVQGTADVKVADPPSPREVRDRWSNEISWMTHVGDTFGYWRGYEIALRLHPAEDIIDIEIRRFGDRLYGFEWKARSDEESLSKAASLAETRMFEHYDGVGRIQTVYSPIDRSTG